MGSIRCASVSLSFILLVIYIADAEVNFRATLFQNKNYKGTRIVRAVSTCSNLPTDFVQNVRSLRTPFRCVMLYSSKSCRGNATKVQRSTADLGDFSGKVSKILNNVSNQKSRIGQKQDELLKAVSISPCGEYSLWPKTLTENWLHLQRSVNHDNVQIRRSFKNDQVAIYTENIPAENNWMNELLTRMWKHVKSTYGISADGERGMLGVVLHAGSAVNHSAESSHLNWWFGNRNAIHLMRTKYDAFDQSFDNSTEPTNLDDMDDLIDSLGWIVRTSTFNVEGQPGNQIFKFDAWSDIFRHDIYTMLGREDLVLRNKLKVRGRASSTSWVSAAMFEDWFLPIYTKYGGSKVLGRFFQLLSEHFPKQFRSREGHDSYVDQYLLISEFVHFWSGAAGTNLKLLAITAFGRLGVIRWEQDFERDQKRYSKITYSQDFVEVELFWTKDFGLPSAKSIVPSCVTLPDWIQARSESLKLNFGSSCIALFSEVGCTGQSASGDQDYRDMQGWNNKIKSVSVCNPNRDNIYRDFLVKSGAILTPGHEGRLVKLAYSDDNVVFYFDKIQAGTNWMFALMSDAWKYVKATYGQRHTGDRSKLTAVLSAGADSDFAVSSSYLDRNAGFKDLIERVYRDPLAFAQAGYNSTSPMNLDYAHTLMDSASWIVSNSAYGVTGSPAPAGVYGASSLLSFSFIFRHDVYTRLGRVDLAEHNSQLAERVQSWSPAGDVYWFRDWYLPIYQEFGGTEVLKRFLKLQADEWPKNDDKSYKGQMNLGDFVHFWSGAARRDLAPRAQEIFHWKREHADQLSSAKQKYSRISY